MSCVANTTATLLIAGMLLSSCTYLQDRTLHEITGVVINPDNDSPLAGVTLILKETRHPVIFFRSFPMDEVRPVAHAVSDGEGRFWFRACVTDPYYVEWERGGFYPQSEGYRESELSDKQAPQVTMKLFARPSLKRERKWTAWLLEDEDTSLTDSCT